MAQLEPAITNPQQQDPPPLRQQSPDLNVRASRQTGAIEAGKETTVHDFLSLCGSKSASSTITAAKIGSQFSVAMQDLLQPLQKAIFPGSGDVLPAGFVLGGSMPHTSSSGDYNGGGQLASYGPVNGGGEMQPNNRSLDFSYVSKAHVPHGVSVNKHWQQQRQGVVALEVLDGNKKLARVVSEDEEDEDDDSFDHGYSSKKEVPYQKFDNAQQLEGKSMDSKGLLTPRSKHSATEQRRRSKINDRFQMLRQLLPNSNQKRDKASFLLEVIEYIQMLHDKVKKYETAELLGQLQEKTKALPWDKTSGCKEGVTLVSYGSSVSTQTNNINEAADATAYTSYGSSPSRVAHEKGITNPDITSIRGHTSSLPNRVFKAPACQPSYENNFPVGKPTVLSFTPVSNSTEEPATPTLFPTGSQTFPDARSMFFQLLHQEEQAAMRGRTSPYSKEETITLPQLHQAGRSMVPQLASALLDPDQERLRSSEQSPSMQRDKRPEVVVEQGRSSPVNDMHEMNTSSNSTELDYDEGRTSHGLNSKYNDKLACVNLEGSKRDCRSEGLADEQGPPAVLGGVVNISSPYSQGLLDTITQALQSSGVDLAQARMSVQINLGKPNASTFTSSKEMATLNTAKLPVVNKGNNFSQDLEPPTKRRMLEDDPTRLN